MQKNRCDVGELLPPLKRWESFAKLLEEMREVEVTGGSEEAEEEARGGEKKRKGGGRG